MLQSWWDVVKHVGKEKFSGDSWVFSNGPRLVQQDKKNITSAFIISVIGSWTLYKLKIDSKSLKWYLYITIFTLWHKVQYSLCLGSRYIDIISPRILFRSVKHCRHTSLQIRMKPPESCSENMRLMWYYHDKLYVPCIPFI